MNRPPHTRPREDLPTTVLLKKHKSVTDEADKLLYTATKSTANRSRAILIYIVDSVSPSRYTVQMLRRAHGKTYHTQNESGLGAGVHFQSYGTSVTCHTRIYLTNVLLYTNVDSHDDDDDAEVRLPGEVAESPLLQHLAEPCLQKQYAERRTRLGRAINGCRQTST